MTAPPPDGRTRRPVRIANCSGFYGDRLSAPRQLLAGPEPIDVLTGDYLAELTMLLLWKARRHDPTAGYAATFLAQMEEVLGTCLDRRIKVVTNAGGLNPGGLADGLEDLAGRLGLPVGLAVVEGDDLVDRLDELTASGLRLGNMDTGHPLAELGAPPVTANAYLGGSGIARALEAGADIVVCGRVTDAALVVGPAAWWHGWGRGEWDRLAGAVVAGHVIECGTQATGGNYCFVDELPDDRYPGFPIAEVADDGSSVITKQPGSGGAVTVGTVTAQLLYEIGDPAYVNPDAVARFDTVRLSVDGPDRVAIAPVRGEPAPEQLKVVINCDGGYRNTMTMVLTGLDVEAKAARALAMLWELLGDPGQFSSVDVSLVRTDRPDAPTNEQATASLRVTVMDPDRAKVGRRFSSAVVELLLASYAGAFVTTAPTDARAYGIYWPTLVPADVVDQRVRLPDGRVEPVPAVWGPGTPVRPVVPAPLALPTPEGPPVRLALGEICGARSGDKGGNANVGLWTWDDEAFAWMVEELDGPRLVALVPEAAGLVVHRYVLANLRAVNYVIVGLLGEGVASSTRMDPQAKGLGEYVRSRTVEVPASVAAARRSAGGGR
ncbi:MAG TPA: acyclic terpene utilization AtuA family protein [Acidimicrobiales bacterium]|nr:acyclic terpene utilization AtuA family protein [Acidimicrobiales bacterium]